MTWHETLAAARSERIDRGALDRVVADVLPGAAVTGVTPIAGGLGSLLDRVELAAAPVDAVVLRRLLPEFGATAATVAREAAAHRTAAAGGVPVPGLLWRDDGGTLGRPALLIDFVPGRPIAGELARPAAVDALAAAVVAIHAVDAGGEGDLPRQEDPAVRLAEEVGAFAATSDLVDVAALGAAVSALLGAFERGDGLLHGDLHGGNVLWDGRVVTGVLDWSEVARGARWHDEAYLVMDTTLAHGADAGERLRHALRGRSDLAPHRGEAWALSFGMALLRALPSPAMWLEGYEAGGCNDLTEELLEERYVALVEDFLDAHG